MGLTQKFSNSKTKVPFPLEPINEAMVILLRNSISQPRYRHFQIFKAAQALLCRWKASLVLSSPQQAPQSAASSALAKRIQCRSVSANPSTCRLHARLTWIDCTLINTNSTFCEFVPSSCLDELRLPTAHRPSRNPLRSVARDP